MSALIERLRVDIAAVRREGYKIDVTPHAKRHLNTRCNLPHITSAVAEYKASDKAWGRLSEIALKYHTLPGTILKRINKHKS